MLTPFEVDSKAGSTTTTVPGVVPDGNATVLVDFAVNGPLPVGACVKVTNGPVTGVRISTVPGTDPEGNAKVVVIVDSAVMLKSVCGAVIVTNEPSVVDEEVVLVLPMVVGSPHEPS